MIKKNNTILIDAVPIGVIELKVANIDDTLVCLTPNLSK